MYKSLAESHRNENELSTLQPLEAAEPGRKELIDVLPNQQQALRVKAFREGPDHRSPIETNLALSALCCKRDH